MRGSLDRFAFVRSLGATILGLGLLALIAASGCGDASVQPDGGPRLDGGTDVDTLPSDADPSPPDGNGSPTTCGVPAEIYDINSQAKLDALAGCARFLGSLRVGDSFFTNLDGLASLRFVDGGLNLFRNRSLVDIDGLRNLETVGGPLYIHFHSQTLTNINGLARLRAVGGDLLISVNQSLVTLAGLEQLRSVGGLGISQNDSLRDLQALSGLETVTGDLSITVNPMLPQSAAAGFVTTVTVGGTITVSDNGP